MAISRVPLGYLPIWVAIVALGCRPTAQPGASDARYLVTESAIDVGDGIELCIAVNLRDAQGIWWWTPGESGCSSRSSGPGVVHADQASVTQTTATSQSALSFRLGTHSAVRPFIDVRLVVEAGRMRALESGAQVTLQSHGNLDVPEMPVSGRR